MTIGGDPDELLRAAAGGPGQAFTVDHAARVVAEAGLRHRTRARSNTMDTSGAVAGLRWLSSRIVRLDAWVARVATALRAADAGGIPDLRSRLLALGASHPAAAAVRDGDTNAGELPVQQLASAELDEIASWPGLPGPWRDRVHRERMRRWLDRLPDRIAAVSSIGTRGPLARVVDWIDRTVVDLASPVVDLHRSHHEEVDALHAQAAGVRRILADPRLTVWSFTPRSATPAGGPAVRVALGDPTTADHLAIVVPGTGTGLHAPGRAVRDAAALHAAASTLAADGEVATVLDLYDAPVDLGRAADPRTGRAAGRATAAFLDDLPGGPRRTTLVGHSYGAYTAAHTARASAGIDAVVLLGAPGVGVLTRDELPAGDVWAARAPGDPVAVVADLDELIASLPPQLRPRSGPLLDPLVGLGPDPTDPEFGADRLPTTATPDGPAVRGHLDYLAPGAAITTRVARVVRGLPPDP